MKKVTRRTKRMIAIIVVYMIVISNVIAAYAATEDSVIEITETEAAKMADEASGSGDATKTTLGDEQNLNGDQKPADEQTPDGDQEPADEQNLNGDQEPADEQNLNGDQEPADEQTPDGDQEPADEQTPEDDQEPADEQTPDGDQDPADEQNLNGDQNPADEQTPDGDQDPADEQTPNGDQEPADEQTPEDDQEPADEQTPETDGEEPAPTEDEIAFSELTSDEKVDKIFEIVDGYGIVTNEATIIADLESSIATEVLDNKSGQTIGSSDKYEDGGHTTNYIGKIEFNGGELQFHDGTGEVVFGNDVNVETREDGWTYASYVDENEVKHEFKVTHVDGNNIKNADEETDVDVEDKLKTIGVLAAAIMQEETSEGVHKDYVLDNPGDPNSKSNASINITDSELKVVYVEVAMSADEWGTTYYDGKFVEKDGLSVYKNEDQICVINVTVGEGTEVISLNEFCIGNADDAANGNKGTTSDPGNIESGSVGKDVPSEIVWNFGDYKGNIRIKSSILGTIIAPFANIIVESTSTGTIVADKFSNPAGEWHSVSTPKPAEVPTPEPTPEVTPTPEPTPEVTPTPTETPEPTPTPTETPEPTPTPTETPEPTPTETPEPTPTPTETPEPTPTPTETPEPTPTPTETPEPTPTETPEPTPTPTETPEPTPTPTETPEPTPTPTETPEPTPTPTETPEPTPTPTETPEPTETPTPGETPAPSEAPTPGTTPGDEPTPTPADEPTPPPTPEEGPTPPPTPEDEPTPGPGEEPTPEITVTPEPGTPVSTPPTGTVLGARRIQESGTRAAVLGARRGSNYAVLGKRRRPATGDSVALLVWILALAAAIGGAITSTIALNNSKKK